LEPSTSPTHGPTVAVLPESSAVNEADETINVLGMDMTPEAVIVIAILGFLVCCLCVFIVCTGLWMKRNSRPTMIRDIVEAINISQMENQGDEQLNTYAPGQGEGVANRYDGESIEMFEPIVTPTTKLT